MKKFIPLTLLFLSSTVFSKDIFLLCDGNESSIINEKITRKKIEKTYVLKEDKLFENDFVLDCQVNPGSIKCFKENDKSKSTWNVDIDRGTGKIKTFMTNKNSSFVVEFEGVCKNITKVF